jgi:hypothetical protein
VLIDGPQKIGGVACEVDPGNWTGSEERVFPWSGRLAEGKT